MTSLTRHDTVPHQNGQTALLSASIGGHTSLARILLDAKADVNLANNVRYGNVHWVDADLYIDMTVHIPVIQEWYTSMYYHVLNIWYYIILNDQQLGVSPLIIGALNGHESLVKLLLEAKADVNHVDNVSQLLRRICDHERISEFYRCTWILL